MKVRFARDAKMDLAATVAYYNGQNPGLGDSFLDEIEAATARIAQFPSAWHKMSRSLRRCRLHRFHGLIYRVRDDSSVAVAAVRGALDRR